MKTVLWQSGFLTKLSGLPGVALRNDKVSRSNPGQIRLQQGIQESWRPTSLRWSLVHLAGAS